MRAFESAGWPTSGEDVVMDLFIFFVFADDPVDGCFTGRYQLEYTTATASPIVGDRATAAAATATSTAAKSDRLVESGIVVGR